MRATDQKIVLRQELFIVCLLNVSLDLILIIFINSLSSNNSLPINKISFTIGYSSTLTINVLLLNFMLTEEK